MKSNWMQTASENVTFTDVAFWQLWKVYQYMSSHQADNNCVMCKWFGIFPITLQYVKLYTHDL